jgi:hypothetical protein
VDSLINSTLERPSRVEPISINFNVQFYDFNSGFGEVRLGLTH